jgi:hypothetical protein
VTVTSLADDVLGDLLAAAIAANGGNPIVLNPGETFEFDYNPDGDLVLNAGASETNTVTVHGEDDEGTDATDDDSHTITATNVAPDITIVKTAPNEISEGGADVTYHFAITASADNASTDPVTVTSLADDVLGDLLAAAIAANGGNPIVLNPGETFEFDYNPDGDLVLNAGASETNTVTVHGEDDEGTDATDDDSHTITATDVAPEIAIEKTGPATVAEGGADVTWHFKITNNSVATDPVTITSLGDDKLGDLLAAAELINGGTIVLAAGASFEFDYNPAGTDDVHLNAGETYTNVVTVHGTDDENNDASATDDHTITATNVAPTIDIQKTVDGDGNGTFNNSEVTQAFGHAVTFQYVLTNTSPAGSVDPLTVQTLVDDMGTASTADDVNLVVGGVLQAGVTFAETGGDADGLLETGETWTYKYTTNVNLLPGESRTNIATVTATDDESTQATDTDDATLTALEGPGVRTPGFWGNLGKQFWDGDATNQTKTGPNFASGELLYNVDSDGDGVINPTAKGLLIGDYDHNGVKSAGEDVFFISLTDALKVIDASQKDLQDGRFVLGRDAVATWLNFLSGNPIGPDTDSNSPKSYLNEAIDWLQTTSGGNNASTYEDWGGGSAVKQSDSRWTTQAETETNHTGYELAGNVIHQELDYYNNTGMTYLGVNTYLWANDGG